MNRCWTPTCVGLVATALALALAGMSPARAGPAARVASGGGTPTPTPAPGPGLCRVTGRQTAGAARLELGQTLGLALTLTASCPVEARGRADILLVYDRSASMADDGKHAAALAAVRTFLDNVDFGYHRVGLVPFNDAPSVIQTLTDRLDRLQRALDASPGPAGSTDIARALEMADAELAATARPEAVGVLVLLTDGRSNEEAMFRAADRARRRGTVVFSIGLGPDANQDGLRQLASDDDFYAYAPGPEALAAIYQRVANYIREFTVTDVRLLSELSEGVSYLPFSAAPVEPEPGPPLAWRRAFVPADGITVTYRVRMERTGTIQPARAAWAQYVDGDGVLRRLDYAPVSVEVYAPVIRPFFLPILFRGQCLPASRHADVVLALDTSSSMREGDKLGQAVAAAKTFLRLLRLPADQAAIVGFDAEGRLVQPLTGDRALLEARLDGLATASGTRLDRGLDVGIAELAGPRHLEPNQRVLVLLSDGRQGVEPGRVAASADLARRMGMTLFSIGLGADADFALLDIVSGSPARSYRAPRPEDLVDIYTQIARVVACR